MITDLHCHYPMHLVHEELEPHARLLDWWDSLRGELEQEVFDLAARFINNPGWGDRWRVDLDGLRVGGVGTVCSVLYWPGDELVPGGGAHPKPGSFEHLVAQIDAVETSLEGEVVVKAVEDLDRGDRRFVHCVEGGFHLGPDPDAIDGHIAELASSAAILYITLAHLWCRGAWRRMRPPIPVLSE